MKTLIAITVSLLSLTAISITDNSSFTSSNNHTVMSAALEELYTQTINNYEYTESISNSDLDYLYIAPIESIKIIEVEDDFELDFNTIDYLPKDFNPLKGKHDLDWSTITIIEIDEDFELGFDTTPYLPFKFNPCEKSNTTNITVTAR